LLPISCAFKLMGKG